MNVLPRFVSAGEALTDLLTTGPATWSAHVGGSTWNVARVMARLGLGSGFAGAVSRDVFGAELVAANTAAQLDPRFLQQVDPLLCWPGAAGLCHGRRVLVSAARTPTAHSCLLQQSKSGDEALVWDTFQTSSMCC
jgi:hypothetical protein